MTAKAIADAVLAIESRVLALGWSRHGVDLWPLYRNEVRGRLSVALLGAAASGPRPPSLAHLAEGLLEPLPTRGGPTTVLLNDGYSRQAIGDRIVDRLCTPLAIGLERAGERTLLLDRGSPTEPALAPRVLGVGGAVWRAKVQGTMIARLPVEGWIARRCEAIIEAALELGLDARALPTPPEMAARQYAMLRLAGLYERVLKRCCARRVLVVDFYGVSGFAMVLAAHRARIPAVDVQHGVIDPEHTAYVAWPRPSPRGHRLLPDGVWTWGEGEARLVREGMHLSPSDVIVGGHPLVAAWQAGWLDGAADARKEAVELRSRTGRSVQALVTLQPGLMGPEALAPLLHGMRNARSVFWWLREHPASRADAKVRALLDETGAAFDLDLPSRLPLYAALEQVDVHLTHSSSTVVEAEAFGVPSLLWSAYGRELFSGPIQRGWCQAVLTGDPLVRAVLAGRATDRPRNGARMPERMVKALECLPGSPV